MSKIQHITLIADENIAGLDDYFCHHNNVNLIKMAGRAITPDIINQHKPHALLIRSVTPINEQSLNYPHCLEFIASATLGIDHVDTNFLAKQNIHFAYAQGSSKHSVAQYVITAILSLRPEIITQTPTLGIIGLGNIGKTLADYADDLGWQVVGFDPFLPTSKHNNSTLKATLNSDIVSIHTPLTKIGTHPTYQLINRQTLALIPKNTLLINAARGEIIHEGDLLDDIQKNGRQVVLDVFPDEPNISSALLNHLTIATPHIAGYTLDGKLRGTDMAYHAFCKHFKLMPQPIFDKLLPSNPHHWQDVKANIDKLADFYSILEDDKKLRQSCDKLHGIRPAVFDKLRKNYPLKREWQASFN